MRGARRAILVLVVVGLLSAGGAAAFLFGRSNRTYDASFDVSVAAPAYAEQHPVVLFDEGHRNAHLTTTGYRPFAELMRNDGYDVRVHSGPIHAETLASVAVLVVNGPRGANDANDAPSFTEAEQTAIVEWVRSGGALLLVTDHWPFGSSVSDLSRKFGVEISGGMAADPEHYEAGLGDTHITYTRANGLLASHPITEGRNAGERVNQVLTFTGQSLSVPGGGFAFMRLGDAAIDYPPTEPQIVREGGDVRVSMNYGDAIPAAGRAQGLAFEFGEGRVVMLGETGMLRAHRDGSDRVGMNYPGYDNRQLALNMMHWLTRLV